MSRPVSLRRSTVAVAALFFVNGATFSNWLPRIPEIRDRLDVGNALLGAALLGGGLGGVVGSLTVGRLSERTGSRRLLTVGAVVLSAGMPLIAVVPEAWALLVLLAVLGVLDVYCDVATNTQAVMVQDRLGRSIMNRMHAMWSLGFTGGAVVGSLAQSARLDIRVHLAAVGAVLLGTVLVNRRSLIDDRPQARAMATAEPNPPRRLPNRAMLAMAFAAMAAITLEFTPNDWAAVFFTDVFDAGRMAGFATVACAGAMLVGRLVGDHVLERVGEHRMITGALWLVGIGVVVTVLAPGPVVAAIGLLVWGLGLAPMFPFLYTAAARLPDTSAGAGLGWMLLGQRAGTMVNSVAVGAVAQWQGMRLAFAATTGVSLVVLARTFRRSVR